MQLGTGLTLLVGGARSGKSDLSVKLGDAWGGPVTFVATSEALDDDMAARITKHQLERPAGWPTVEQPLFCAADVAGIPGDHLLILDCITLLVSNLLFAEQPIAEHVEALAVALAGRHGPTVVVSNEVGMGVHPETSLGRIYRDELGRANRIIADHSDDALLIVAGRAIPLAPVTWPTDSSGTSAEATLSLDRSASSQSVLSPELPLSLLPSRWTEELPEPCQESIAAISARIDEILRPDGALARLDEVAQFLAGWQRTASPSVDNPACLIFAGDHGVAAEGVSAYPADVTGAMFAAVNQGKASVAAMAAVAGASVKAVDVGVGKPTANFRSEPAMDHSRMAESFQAGRQAVADLGPTVDLVIVGELGIGNTTAAAAVTAALLGRPAAVTVGGGTGVANAELENKVRVVEEAVARAVGEGAGPNSPMEVLRQLGGTELAAIAGAIVEARQRSIAVLLDGYVTAAPALALHRWDNRFGQHLLAGHGSAEPGHRLILDVLGLTPLLDLGLRLGEGSGAMAALPLVKMAAKLTTDVPTFTEWFGSQT